MDAVEGEARIAGEEGMRGAFSVAMENRTRVVDRARRDEVESDSLTGDCQTELTID